MKKKIFSIGILQKYNFVQKGQEIFVFEKRRAKHIDIRRKKIIFKKKIKEIFSFQDKGENKFPLRIMKLLLDGKSEHVTHVL